MKASSARTSRVSSCQLTETEIDRMIGSLAIRVHRTATTVGVIILVEKIDALTNSTASHMAGEDLSVEGALAMDMMRRFAQPRSMHLPSLY